MPKKRILNAYIFEFGRTLYLQATTAGLNAYILAF